MPEPGTLVAGRYRVVRSLGRGGFGVVHEVEDTVLGRRVALKLLRFPRDVAGFEREAQALARLRHPNLVTVHDFVSDQGLMGLTVELVEHGTLADLLASRRLDWREAVALGLQIARGLEHAHARGVIHGDIKPSNVLLDADGRVKVTDFGTARFTDAAAEGEGLFIGTVAYAAPERLAGEPVSAATDIHALGVLLFELIAGKLPYRGDGTEDIATLIGTAPPPSLRAEAPDVPADLERFVTACLAKHPSARPPGMAAARGRLEAITGLGESSLPQPVPDRLRIARARPAASGECRRVVVMAAALRHLDDALDHLPPDDAREWAREEMSRVMHLVGEHGGLIHDAGAASLLAVFGLEGARELSAPEAVACALALASPAPDKGAEAAGGAPGEVPAEARPPLPARRTAAVVMGTRASAPNHDRAWLLRDDAVRQATVLLEHAASLEVLATADVVRACRDRFVFEPLAPLQSRRKDDPVRIHRLVPGAAPDLRGLPLVGRQHEFGLAMAHARQAIGGQGLSVSIEGAAGAGKTRLLEETLSRLGTESPDAAIARVVVPPGSGQSSRRLMAEMFESVTSAVGDAVVAESAIPAAELALMRSGGQAAGLGMTPAERDAGLAHGWQLFLAHATADRPLVIAIEDLHWAGQEACAQVARLAEASRGRRILWLLTYRQDFPPPWAGRPHHRPMVLGPLDEDARAALAGEILGQPPGPLLQAFLRDNSEGLALHVLELVKSLRDDGNLQALTTGDLDLSPGAPPACPVTLEGILASRLEPLTPPETLLLQACAVLGARFEPAVALEMVGLQGTDAGDDQHLDRIIDLGLVEPPREGSRQHAFRHEVLRAVVRDSMLAPRRRALHGLAARVLASAHDGDDPENLLAVAHHQAESDAPASALPTLCACAERLVGAGDMAEALVPARRALELAERLRLPVAAVAPALEVAATAASAIHDPSAADFARRALEVARASGDRRREATALLALGRALGRGADARAALEVLVEGQAVAEAAGLTDVAERLLAAQLGPLAALGDTDRAQRVVSDLERQPGRSNEAIISGLRERARQLFLHGDLDESLRAVDDALARVSESSDPLLLLRCLAQRCPVLAGLGRLAEAREAAEAALRLAVQEGMRPTESYLRAFLAHAQMRMGNLAAASAHAREARELADRLGSRWDLAVALRTSAEVALEHGDLVRGLEWAGQAVQVARDQQAAPLHAAALLARAELHVTLGAMDAARADVEDAMRILHEHEDADRSAAARGILARLDAMSGSLPGPPSQRDAQAAARALAAARSEGCRLDEARALLACAALGMEAADESPLDAAERALAIARDLEAVDLGCAAALAAARLGGSVERAASLLRERARGLPADWAASYLGRPDRRAVLDGLS